MELQVVCLIVNKMLKPAAAANHYLVQLTTVWALCPTIRNRTRKHTTRLWLLSDKTDRQYKCV